MNFELFFPFSIPKRVLKAFGTWIEEGSTVATYIKGIVMHLFFIELYTFLQLVFLFTFKDFEDFTLLMTLLPTYIGLFFKTSNFAFKMKQIKRLMAIIEDLSTYCKETEKLKKYLEKVDKISKLYMTLAFCGCLTGAFLTIYELPYKMWFPYDINNRFNYWISAIYQIIDSNICAQVTICIDLIPIIFMCYVVAFLDILCDRLQALKKEKIKITEFEDFLVPSNEELSKCIEFGIKIGKCVELIEETFSTIFFAQGFFSTLILCTISFSLSLITDPVKFVRLFSYLIPMLLEIYLPCYFGNEITLMSEKLSENLFHSEWPEENKKFRFNMLVAMEKMKRSLKIAAFGVFGVNMNTFTDVCRSTYSLFAVFKNIHGQKENI
ncbi:CLUMA_CG000794, isoform A [Clunio marinus]|uniref:Odorant receptor n=1 Tax=Clunio marinus TaxID=568069 RepID=A0A1J1HG25_9DIPT|nr:CLUMA_CG000794, isoform A [Clunio marinus]